MSPICESIIELIFATLNNEGDVGGLSAYPLTFAPKEDSHQASQLPLNAVCPVK